ncbi:MAG: nucleoside transporter C-terminal domain-containing protein [Planctomycetota bacterium]
MSGYNLVSFGGLFVLMGVAWVFSTNRRRMNWRLIAVGVGAQLAVGLVVFWTPGVRWFFVRLNGVVVELLDATVEGPYLVFGRLALQPGETRDGLSSLGYFLAFRGLPLVIFFAALMNLLYYCRVMPVIIRGFAWFFTRVMRVSGAESLCAASNIFVGIESATTIRPYLGEMTRSELCTVLTAGMATVASTVLGVYVLYLSKTFETIAGHLISASLLSAPAAIVMSKILVPEEGEPVTLGRAVEPAYERESGAIEAIINGAMAGVKLVVGIVALLIAFLGLIGVLDQVLAWCGVAPLQTLLGYVFYPFAVVLGVPPADAAPAAQLLGQRLVATEVPAYRQLAAWLEAETFEYARTKVVVAYALCGFAHVASLAIFVGGVAALVPARRKDLAAVGPRALLAATLACLMTGAVAGALYHGAATVL